MWEFLGSFIQFNLRVYSGWSHCLAYQTETKEGDSCAGGAGDDPERTRVYRMGAVFNTEVLRE